MVLFFFLVSILIFVLFSIVFVLFVISQFIAAFSADAPFVPVPDFALERIVENMDLKKSSVLYDLGCGDGRVLLAASKQFPEVKMVGIEIALVPYWLAKFKTRKHPNIEIRRENFFKTDFRDATHIFLFLYPEVVNRLLSKSREKFRPETIIASCDFEIKSMTAQKIIDLGLSTKDPIGNRLFIYVL